MADESQDCSLCKSKHSEEENVITGYYQSDRLKMEY